jgi:FolB domain-containing protein
MKEKIVLVTGGARRIGRAICLQLASHGYRVIIHYRSSKEEAKNTRQACLAAGASMAEILHGDLSDLEARSQLLSQAIDLTGEIDLLVNSASMFEYDTAQTFDSRFFNNHLQTNFLAPVELTMSLHQLLTSKNKKAHVVTLLDQKVFNLNTDYASYTLAKLASQSSIRYLAQCCAPTLRVNAIAPGVSATSGSMTEGDFLKAQKIAALGASSTPEDIASAVYLLDNSPAITGQTLVVDGGQHLLPWRLLNKDPKMQKWINLAGLNSNVSIGIHEFERVAKQPYTLNISLQLHSSYKTKNDSIEEAVDYDRLRSRVLSHLDSQHFNLQETVIQNVIDICFELDLRVIAIDISTAKTAVYPDCASVGLHYISTREEWLQQQAQA